MLELVPMRRGLRRRFGDEMDRLFDRFSDWSLTPSLTEPEMWAPAIDVSERDDAMVIRAELPGMDPKDVDITVQGGILSICGEKKHEEKTEDESVYRAERCYGSFRRDIRLPDGLDYEKIEAHDRNGVLTITVPKGEQAKPRHIEVKS